MKFEANITTSQATRIFHEGRVYKVIPLCVLLGSEIRKGTFLFRSLYVANKTSIHEKTTQGNKNC